MKIHKGQKVMLEWNIENVETIVVECRITKIIGDNIYLETTESFLYSHGINSYVVKAPYQLSILNTEIPRYITYPKRISLCNRGNIFDI